LREARRPESTFSGHYNAVCWDLITGDNLTEILTTMPHARSPGYAGATHQRCRGALTAIPKQLRIDVEEMRAPINARLLLSDEIPGALDRIGR
jgi:hypothetical protein